MAASRVVRVLGLLVLTVTLVVSMEQMAGIGEQDLIVYWSAARLLATGGNPYDVASLRALQSEVRPDRAWQPQLCPVSWNPPWLLVAILPLGLLPFDVAAIVWLLGSIFLIIACSFVAWRLLNGPFDGRKVALVTTAALWFFPSWSTIVMGQISTLILFGLVIGVWWLRLGRDGWAGAALFLLLLKPHITYFLLFVLVAWVIRARRWRVFGGMLAATVASIGIASILFPGWPAAYLDLHGGYQVLQYSTSTVSGLAYALWRTNLFRWAGLLVIPLAPFILRLTESHGWLTALNVALLISVPLAPYGFVFDHLVLLPAVLQIICWLGCEELPKRSVRGIGAGLALVYLGPIVMLVLPVLQYPWFVWPAVALAGLYALAWRQRLSWQRVYGDGLVA